MSASSAAAIGDLVSLGGGSTPRVGDAVITFTYLGQESGYLDATGRASFSDVLLTEADAIGTQASFVVPSGTDAVVDFKFFDSVGGSAVNGGPWSANNSIGLLGSNVTGHRLRRVCLCPGLQRHGSRPRRLG